MAKEQWQIEYSSIYLSGRDLNPLNNKSFFGTPVFSARRDGRYNAMADSRDGYYPSQSLA
jgi:hypothetical protein